MTFWKSPVRSSPWALQRFFFFAKLRTYSGGMSLIVFLLQAKALASCEEFPFSLSCPPSLPDPPRPSIVGSLGITPRTGCLVPPKSSFHLTPLS